MRRAYEDWEGIRLFGCSEYINPVSGKNDCWPRFCPEAICIPCLMYGSNISLFSGEEPWNYNLCRSLPLGDLGALATVGSCLSSLFIWWPLTPLLCCLVGHQRLMIRKRYYPEEPIKWTDICIGCLCAPCGVYQHFEFLLLKTRNINQPVIVTGIPIQQNM